MNEQVIVFLVAGLLACILLLSGFVSRYVREKAWRELADQTGLKYQPGNLLSWSKVVGNYRGHSMTMELKPVLGGRSARLTNIMLVVENPTDAYLKLVKGWLDKIVDFPELRTGDIDFDRKVRIVDQPANFAAIVLASEHVRRRLLKIGSFEMTLHGRELTYKQLGIITGVSYLQSVFDLLHDLTMSIEACKTQNATEHAPHTTP